MRLNVSKVGLNMYFKIIPSGEMKGEQYVTISNGLAEDISVKIEPINLVVQNEKSEKHVAIGANATGIKLEVSLIFKISNV